MAVTITELRKIIETDATDDTLQAFATVAESFVSNAGLSAAGLSATTVAQIEKFVAAHFVAANYERQAKREDIGDGDYEIEYTGEFGSGLKSTTYGQTALLMDTTGLLASISESNKSATIKSFTTPAHTVGNVADY